ncbi:NUDIX domain-containing protein [Vibrio sp. S9_S30]|uniref:NUDIX domain-containing protein n=1 Tax=Vibrio sp. S9_S30 TaxID=2720226 RepID=UPI001EEE833C|nr:NUDIX domain-containing protein [Vibrio sp. S9_S30]
MILGVAAVILDERKRLLIQQKQDGSWSLPAGMIEPSESPSAAIKREVLEETGYTVSAMKILGAFVGEGFSALCLLFVSLWLIIDNPIW